MKRILIFLGLLVVCLSGNAYATAQRTATIGDLNDSGVYRLRADMDTAGSSNCTSSQSTCGWVVYAQDTGIFMPYATSTTNTTLVPSQSGTTFVSTSTSTNAAFTLPTAAVGMDYTIVAGSAKQLQVRVQSTDTIAFASLAAGQGLVNSTAALGDTIELFCYVANTWVVKNHDGTWTHTGASP